MALVPGTRRSNSRQLFDSEAEARGSLRLGLCLEAAKPRPEATIEDVDFRTSRGLTARRS
jgi:hypothetical protein